MYKEIEKLLVLSKEGDVEAKERLLNKLTPLIISSIRRYYNKKDQYDDLMQDAYETILLAIEEYDPQKGVKFLGYVKAMLKYRLLEKHRERDFLSLNSPMEEGEFIDMLEDPESPMDIALEREERKLLLQALKALAPRQREVIIAFYIDGLSIQQIADKLGLSYRTVVNSKTQGLKKLKNIMVK
ncbi:MAG: sigma-70 family RNA polymerase sigma factor [Tissierellia bacterium]|nr:sigma-70 family RNA polymerase sigma factor [Tissierellia bacterium]